MIGIMVVSWPFNLILGKVAMRYFPAMAVVSLRITIAAMLMLPIYWFTRSRRSFVTGSKKGLDTGDLRTFVLLALLGVVINQGCFILGLNYTTVGHSALIIGMAPISILVLAWTQGLEVVTRRKIAGMAMAFTGVTVLAVEKGLHLHSGTLVGDLLTLCASAGFALYTVIAKKVAWKYDSITVNTLNYLLSAILMLPIAIYELVLIDRSNGWNRIEWKGWVGVAYMGIFGSVIAFLIYTWALRYIAASRMGAVSYTHPIVSTTLGVLWLGEVITRNLVIGGTLILLGIYLIQSGKEPEKQDFLLEEIESM
jgi:drug/metabolite transporter (DMT)-like permease